MSVSYDPGTNTATFSYTGNASGITGVLADGNYRATLIASGITNHDGRVNLADFNRLAANFGQSPRDFSQGDFTYDTVVNLADFNVLAGRFGAVLAAPSMPVEREPLGRTSLFASIRTADQRVTRDVLDELLE